MIRGRANEITGHGNVRKLGGSGGALENIFMPDLIPVFGPALVEASVPGLEADWIYTKLLVI